MNAISLEQMKTPFELDVHECMILFHVVYGMISLLVCILSANKHFLKLRQLVISY